MITLRPKYRFLYIRRTGLLPSTYSSRSNNRSSSDESSNEDVNNDELGSDDQDSLTIDRDSLSNESTFSDDDLFDAAVGSIAKNVFYEFLSTDIKEKAGALFPGIPRDELAFAHWAFGPDGLTTLQVLALGDFSFRGRFANDQVLLCRQEQRTSGSADDALSPTAHAPELMFREVISEDRNLQALVDTQGDLLEACPVDSLLRPL